MVRIGQGTPPAQWLSDDPRAEEITSIVRFLTAQGTFEFPTFKTGLFSAAIVADPEFRLTGYQNAWVRDNIHIAHALWVLGETQAAARCVGAVVQFFSQTREKFVRVIEDLADSDDVALRPHVRFDGENLAELDVHWAHAQNDALGYTLWLACRLLRSGDLQSSPELLDVLDLIVWYFAKIEYWQDEDSGHWEEARKIEASSIGAVVAGLTALQAWLHDAAPRLHKPFNEQLLSDCIEQGQTTLKTILPAECVQQDPLKNRQHDAALLFLCYPLQIVDDAMIRRIVENVCTHLLGPIGIRRYIGDSYWCADYRDLLPPETRTTDYSEDMSVRDRLLHPGEEAQWCLFDPIISIIHAQRYLKTNDAHDRQLQIEHLRRSLAQLTTSESRFDPYRCPESYFLEHGQWIPNDITPLLWTQANLRLALHWMEKTSH